MAHPNRVSVAVLQHPERGVVMVTAGVNSQKSLQAMTTRLSDAYEADIGSVSEFIAQDSDYELEEYDLEINE